MSEQPWDPYCVPAGDDRNDGIGGSEAALLHMGALYQNTITDLWSWKLGKPPRSPIDPRLAALGNALEPLTFSLMLQDLDGYVVLDDSCDEWQDRLRSRTYDFMTCTPDGWATVGGQFHTVQLKTAGRMDDKWPTGDGIVYPDDAAGVMPKHVWIQVQHEMYVTGAEMAIGYCFGGTYRGLGGSKPVFIERDETFLGIHLKRCEEFWDCVIAGREDPDYRNAPVSGSSESRKYLSQLFPPTAKTSPSMKWHGQSPVDMVDEYLILGPKIKAMQDRRSSINSTFAKAIVKEDTEVIVLDDGRKVSWKKGKDGKRTRMGWPRG